MILIYLINFCFSAAQMNPNVNFMCTLGDDFNMNQRQMNFNQNPGRNLGNSSLRHISRERSPFRPNMQNSVNFLKIYFSNY